MNNVLKTYITMLILFLMTPHSVNAQAGKSGLAFLKLGISGRGIAMGDAMSAIVSGAAATYYNPAGILAATSSSTAQLMFMHKEWIQDTRVEFLGSSILLDDDNAIGFSLNSTTISNIEIRTRPGTPEGSFTAPSFSLGASFAHALFEDLRVGITGKLLYQKILIDESSGFGIDVGAQYRTFVENLSVGAVVANVGSMSGLRGGSTKLPTLLRVGPGYAYQLEGINSTLRLASDVLYIFPEHKSYLNAGGELSLNEIIAARLGYQFGSEGRGFSGGLGVAYGIFLLDYAYTHLNADLGNAHTVSLALNF
jgi:hypothetical protein